VYFLPQSIPTKNGQLFRGQRIRTLAVVLATALLSLSAGTAIGYYVIADDEQGKSAQCIILAKDLREFTYVGVPENNVNSNARRILEQYDENCR